MIKRIAIVLLVVLSYFFSSSSVQAEPVKATSSLQEATEAIDLSQVEEYINQLDKEMQQHLPQFSLSGLFEQIRSGKLDISAGALLSGLLKLIFSEFVGNFALLGQLLILSVLAAVLQNVQSSFSGGSSSKVAYTVIYLVIFSLAMKSFLSAMSIGTTAIERMTDFTQAVFPILITLLAAMGGLASAAVLNPLLLVVVSGASTVIKNVIMPLFLLGAVLGLLNFLHDKYKLSNLADLFRDAGKYLVGVLMIVFMGLTSIESMASSVADGVALRTVKYTTDAFIPVVGGKLADAMEAMIGGAVLLKSTLGIVGVIVIVVICCLPSIKILAMVLTYRLAGALVQPLGAGRVGDCLIYMSKSLSMVFGAVAIVGMMFFFSIVIVVGAGNLTTMLR